ncbi:hypothetical protein EJ074_16815 [Mesorhizobium sp. M3A.F.Ca.ET.080.04.2.1]|nr:hypothetical protein EJ074_16815 [Mesorhizobium sp. M3A.F.Ca.ET.080.04.2.1]PBB88105.1 hypothetical protein CK216_06225 [Mesorhizobium sp. WSM3876]
MGRIADPHNLQPNAALISGDDLLNRLAGQHPPLSCRTSPPQGGRLAVTSAFANLQRSQFRSKAERARHSPSIASAIRAMACW